MKALKIKLVKRTIEEMLNDTENASYNPSIWKEKIDRFAKFKNIQFYINPKNEERKYDEFYASYYIPEGLYLFSKWDAFSSTLTNSGFKRIILRDDELYVNGFGEDYSKVIVNNKEGRKWLADNVCKYGVMVSTNF